MNPLKSDSWEWVGNRKKLFTTKELTKMIKEKSLGAGTNALETLRNYLVPKKVEVFIWRARKGRLSARVELDKWGVDLDSVRCPLCDNDIETVGHSLLLCKKVEEIWVKIFAWWGVSSSLWHSLSEMLQTGAIQQNLDSGALIWQAVIWISCYLIWKNRNQVVFNNKGWCTPNALNEIQIKSFEWVAKRIKGRTLDWHNWFHNPACFVN
ncbi:uncharacterized protein [Rutidosis leptorrhynchoides]|uniref:uncharacterized protein n=1 Tax=Rutidosis leptorrhynchoides TaxID=125765 RepID=UPI003A98FD14